MLVDLGKNGGFVITGTNREMTRLSMLPGARLLRGVVRMPYRTSSWKSLRGLGFTYTPSAENAMRALASSYYEGRRTIRSAERRFKKSGKVDIPVPLKTIPYSHQVKGFGFASQLDHCGLLCEPGTGKTLIALAVTAYRYEEGQAERILVVCPKQIKKVWRRELGKHFKFKYRVSLNHKPYPSGAQYWIVNYDRLKSLMPQILKWKPQMMLLDESHRIRSRRASWGKLCVKIGDRVKYRLILTGTVFGKCISEVWQQFRFLNREVFGTYSEFKSRYLRLGGFMGKKVVGYQNEEEFARKMHSVCFSVSKAECLDLPPVTTSRVYLQLDKKAQKIYNEILEDWFTLVDEDEVSVDREISQQIKLRQISGGTLRSDSEAVHLVSRVKVEALRDILSDRTGKVVVFFSFTQEIEEAAKVCQSLGLKFLRLQGSTPEHEREVFEERFQEDPEVAVALIQIQTGGEGITLTSSNHVVIYSPSFSAIYVKQAIDRVDRIGQTVAVTVSYLVVEGTVDERVVDVLESNFQLARKYLEHHKPYQVGDQNARSKKPVRVQGRPARRRIGDRSS